MGRILIKHAVLCFTIVSSGWLSVCMLLGDVGDTDIHKQHDAVVTEMRACLFITSRDNQSIKQETTLVDYSTQLSCTTSV